MRFCILSVLSQFNSKKCDTMARLITVLIVSSLIFCSCNGSQTPEPTGEKTVSRPAEPVTSPQEKKEKVESYEVSDLFTLDGTPITVKLELDSTSKWNITQESYTDRAFAKVPMEGGGNIELNIAVRGAGLDGASLDVKPDREFLSNPSSIVRLSKLPSGFVGLAHFSEKLYGDSFRMIMTSPNGKDTSYEIYFEKEE